MENMQLQENREIPQASMVLYYANPEDTLWEIAKRFHSTVDEIQKINTLAEGETIARRQLFIPRYVPARNV